MKNIVAKRAVSLAVAVGMVFLLLMGAMPVRAAGMQVTATVEPGTVSAGESFSIKGVIKDSLTKGKDESIIVTGLGGIKGTETLIQAFDANGNASFLTTAGKLTYTGNGAGMVQVTVGTETSNSSTISGFKETETSIPDGGDDTPITPTKPTGNVFMVQDGTALPSLKAGETKTITIPVVNSTTKRYTDAQFSIALPDKVYYDAASSTQKLSFNGKETKDLQMTISADSALATGVYPATVKVAYKYGSLSTEESFTFNIKVSGATDAGKGKLNVTGYRVNPGTVNAGTGFTLTLTVKNTGTGTYKDAAVTLGGLTTDTFTMNNSLDTQYIASLAAGASTELTFKLDSSTKMASGNYVVDIAMAAGEDTSSAKAFVEVKGTGKTDEETGKTESKPQIVIESYDYGGVSVTGGKVFTLSMVIKNTGKVAIENVKMTVSSVSDATTGGAFSPANSSNTFFVRSIPAGGTITQSIDLLPKADAAPKSYGLEIAFNYEAIVNKERVELTPTETLSIPLTQPDRFEVGDLQLYGPVMVGETLSGYVSYVNKGKSTIFNLSVKVEGEGFTTAETESYVGNVESGSGDGYELVLNTSAAGPITGKITFSYEDSNGDIKEIVKDFESEAIENNMGEMEPPVDPMLPVDGDGQGGFPLWGWIAIIGGGVLVAGIVVVIVVKVIKKKKKKAQEAEDDYDDTDSGNDAEGGTQ